MWGNGDISCIKTSTCKRGHIFIKNNNYTVKIKQFVSVLFLSIILVFFQNCRGSFESDNSVQRESQENGSSLPQKTFCVPGQKIANDCTIEIASSMEASRVKVCNASGSEFVFGGSCDLKKCAEGFSVSNNLCVTVTPNPDPICQASIVDSISCVDEVNFALIATKTRTCNEDEQSYSIGTTCSIQSCMNGFTLQDNTCVLDTPPPQNSAPIASVLSFSLNEGATHDGQLLATDADGDALTYSIKVNPSKGVATINSNGSFSYMANSNATGADSFRFVANDGTVNSKRATVSVTITASGPPASADCTVVIPDGTYDTNINGNSFPTGAVVCAATDGGVTYTGSFNPSGFSMRGFIVSSNKEKSLSNGTFERMSFVGGPDCGNVVNTNAGNNTTIKDSAFFGLGGRYLFLTYEASGVQITNAIFRVDGGWGEKASCNEYEPNAAINIYDSNNVVCDGCVNLDQNSTAQNDSELLGGLGINAHTSNLCHDVEIKNSIDYKGGGFWSGGNGKCDTLYTNNIGDLNFNLDGTTNIVNSTASTCDSWSNGSVKLTASNISSGNCSGSGTGATLNLNTSFLNDPRWRTEMCGGQSERTDGWCATQMTLSDYVSQ
jgi:VCBS repeat-containing protein